MTARASALGVLLLCGWTVASDARGSDTRHAETPLCPRAVTLLCRAQGSGSERIIWVDGASYASLKPHGARGKVKRCTAGEILIDDASGRLAIDRLSGRYVLRATDHRGQRRIETGECVERARP